MDPLRHSQRSPRHREASNAAKPETPRSLKTRGSLRRPEASKRSDAPKAQQARIVRAFKQAWEAKNLDALIGLLDPDATLIADGGGLADTVLHPIEGGEEIARAWIAFTRLVTDLEFVECTVNGQPGLVAQRLGVTVTVYAFEIAEDRIRTVFAVRNPEKLRPWTAN